MAAGRLHQSFANHLPRFEIDRPRRGEVSELNIETRDQVFNVDYAKPIRNGANSVGFDYYYGISASLDMVPYTYIENGRVTALPTEDRDFPLFLGRPQGFCRKGPAAPAGPIPVSKSTWWAGIKSGRYPKPVKLGPRITAWRVEDIRALIESAAG